MPRHLYNTIYTDPASIFVRKNAVVLNLEGLKVVVSKEKVLVISAPPPNDLSLRLKPTLDSPVVRQIAAIVAMSHEPGLNNGDKSMAALAALQVEGDDQARPVSPATSSAGSLPAAPPFEIRAIEACLLLALTILGREIVALEARTHPVISRIRCGVNRNDLEALFDIRNALNKTSSRTSRLKDILEEILDDESEMAGMCLSHCENDEEAADAGQQCPEISMDMDEEEVSELEDMIEAHWLVSCILIKGSSGCCL